MKKTCHPRLGGVWHRQTGVFGIFRLSAVYADGMILDFLTVDLKS